MGLFTKIKNAFGRKKTVGYMRCMSCGTTYTAEEDKLNEENICYRCDCGNEIDIPFFTYCKVCNEIVAVTQGPTSQVASEILGSVAEGFFKPWTALKSLGRFFDNIPSANGWGICPFCNTRYIRCPNCNFPVEVKPGTGDNDVLMCPNCGQQMRQP